VTDQDPNLFLHSDPVIKHLLFDNLPILPMGDRANLDVEFRVWRLNHVSIHKLTDPGRAQKFPKACGNPFGSNAAWPPYRCVAHDRRGQGRSDQPWKGNDMDTYADDLAALVQALDLRDAIHVGHSTGGGGVARYIGRHGTKRVAKAVLISAVPPLVVKTPANPGGLPMEVLATSDCSARARTMICSTESTV
jgi:pimeloyl-ACP methyl ester carboxylesterase